jgi:hypothetical protein
MYIVYVILESSVGNLLCCDFFQYFSLLLTIRLMFDAIFDWFYVVYHFKLFRGSANDILELFLSVLWTY